MLHRKANTLRLGAFLTASAASVRIIAYWMMTSSGANDKAVEAVDVIICPPDLHGPLTPLRLCVTKEGMDCFTKGPVALPQGYTPDDIRFFAAHFPRTFIDLSKRNAGARVAGMCYVKLSDGWRKVVTRREALAIID